jgi:hypothetical protein
MRASAHGFARLQLPHRSWIAAPLALVLALGACDVPTFEGPQLQTRPEGFLLVEGSYPPRQLVSGSTPVFRTAWVESSADASSIFIVGYPVVLGYEDALAARDSSRRYAHDAETNFGEVEPIRVDGRDGWGWEERVETPRRGLVWVAYRALIPYDTITYAIEFSSGNPRFKGGAPETLRAVISTFGVGRTTYNIPLIALLLGIALLVVAFLRSKAQARAKRLQSINLVKFPKKQPAVEPAASAVVTPPGAPASTSEAPVTASPRPYPDWRTPKPPAHQGS